MFVRVIICFVRVTDLEWWKKEFSATFGRVVCVVWCDMVEMDVVGQCFGLVRKCIGWWTYFGSFIVVFCHALVFDRVIICFVCVSDREWRKKEFSTTFGRVVCGVVWYGGNGCSGTMFRVGV